MSIDKFSYEAYEVCCDENDGKCLGCVNWQETSFEDLIEELKADGWIITKEDGVWKHTCKFH